MSQSARRLVTSFRNLTKVGPQREPAGTEFREQKNRHADSYCEGNSPLAAEIQY